MASLSSVLYSCVLVLLFNFVTSPWSQAEGVIDETKVHVVSVQSLFPKQVCTSSKDSDPSKLQLAHRHGPCSPLKRKHRPNSKQILNNDQHRVDWIQTKSAAANATTPGSQESLAASTITVQDGSFLGTDYIITVGFGTPKVTQSITFDTGSDITWIQCQPCAGTCYRQKDPLFNPAKSSTYVNISCNSPYCSALDNPSCSGSTCVYRILYGDYSHTEGFFAQDRLSLSSSSVVNNFRFGCGENNNGIFGLADGLMGLGRNQVSLVMQTAQKFGGVFSYCLPATASSTGYLSFGPTSATNVQYTPMLTQSSAQTFYFLDLMSVSVSGQNLAIPGSLFSTAGTIIDSGTVITWLPPTAYKALRDAFRKGMTKYPTAPATPLLDTCYDLSKYKTVAIPTVALQFRGSTMNIDPQGTMYVESRTQVCLAFAPNSDDTDIVIIGSTQQKRFNVVYDVIKKQIGFGHGNC